MTVWTLGLWRVKQGREDDFVEGVARIRDCLESFEPHTMDQVVEVTRD